MMDTVEKEVIREKLHLESSNIAISDASFCNLYGYLVFSPTILSPLTKAVVAKGQKIAT